MKALELYQHMESRITAIATDESRWQYQDLKQLILSSLATARGMWVKQNGGRKPYQWFLTEVLSYDCANSYDSYEEKSMCVIKFQMPNFVNIGAEGAMSITFPNGKPISYIANSYAEFQGWLNHSFFKKETLAYIHDGMLHLNTKAVFTSDDCILVTGVPYDPEEISTFNPQHDDINVTPDIVDIAIDKVIKPMIYTSNKKVDGVSNSKDNS